MLRNACVLFLALCTLTALAPAGLAQDEAAPLLVEADPSPGEGAEWVELANPTPVDLDLDGLYLTDHDPCFAPGEGYVETYRFPLEGEVDAMDRRVVELPAACLTLADSGDELALEDEAGHELQAVAYGTSGGPPAPGAGESLAACEHALLVHGAWGVHPATPGAANPACAPAGVR